MYCSVTLFALGGIGCHGIEPCNFVWYYSTGHTLHQPQNVSGDSGEGVYVHYEVCFVFDAECVLRVMSGSMDLV